MQVQLLSAMFVAGMPSEMPAGLFYNIKNTFLQTSKGHIYAVYADQAFELFNRLVWTKACCMDQPIRQSLASTSIAHLLQGGWETGTPSTACSPLCLPTLYQPAAGFSCCSSLFLLQLNLPKPGRICCWDMQAIICTPRCRFEAHNWYTYDPLMLKWPNMRGKCSRGHCPLHNAFCSCNVSRNLQAKDGCAPVPLF